MICHQHQCVFVHIPKCAGQSIERLFVKQVGLKWSTRAPLLLRSNPNPKLGPPRLAHLKATEYVDCKYMTQEMFDEYFKFALVRNPFSRLVSIYKYLGFRHRLPFRAFIREELESSLSGRMRWFVGPQSDFLFSDDDKPLVDYIGRVENIEEDFQAICEQIDFPYNGVPHRNRSGNARPRFSLRPRRLKRYLASAVNRRRIPVYERYQDYYDAESIAVVERLYERDIRLLGYSI